MSLEEEKKEKLEKKDEEKVEENIVENIEESKENKDEQLVTDLSQVNEDLEVHTFEDTSVEKREKISYNTEAKKEKRSIFSKIIRFLDKEDKELKKLEKQALKIISLEDSMRKLSDEELKGKTDYLKKELENGKSLEDILEEAFAVAREASRRVLGMNAYKVQLMGGIALHNGDIAEMKTGEGKTLTAIFPVYLNALTGKGVHVITVNEYLAERDATENGKVFTFLGLTVGLNKNGYSKEQKRKEHACDITYTTHAELGFDYLKDNMVKMKEQKVLRGLNFCLIDEVDSVLIDEAKTPLIISGGQTNNTGDYIKVDQFVKSLKQNEYDYDIQDSQIALNEKGVEYAEQYFNITNLFDPENISLLHKIIQSLRANYILEKDKDYMIATTDGSGKFENAKIMLIDSFTGRVMTDRNYSEGLHQAVEAKEGVKINPETKTLATITYQNFFRLFNKLSGMTGTAKNDEDELRQVYNMRVIQIPTNRPVIREDAEDKIFATKEQKFKALYKEISKRHSYGQPILIGTVAVETSEEISQMLKKRGIPHNVLNAKNHSREAEIIKFAGVKGAVTIATNMAGRGTDIKLGEEVKELGGLAVLGSERHESRRIDDQLRGRSGRQGDPGYTCFFVSFDDDLMKHFGNENVLKMVKLMGDKPIQDKSLTKAIEQAQKRVEGENFASRKNTLEYDDVMRQQREIVYKDRDAILEQEDLSDVVKAMFHTTVDSIIKSEFGEDKKEIELSPLLEKLSNKYTLFFHLVCDKEKLLRKDMEHAIEVLTDTLFDCYRSRYVDDVTPDQITTFERNTLLGITDYLWQNHIDAMDKLKNGIYLRSYAQKNPLREYTNEGFYMFEQLVIEIAQTSCDAIRRMGIPSLGIDEEAKKVFGDPTRKIIL